MPPHAIGDIYERTISSYGVKVIVRWEVDALFPPDPLDDPDTGPLPSDGTPIEFAVIDRRTAEDIATWSHRYNENQLDVVTQYISADPDNPTFHTITNPMQRFFRWENGLSLGVSRR